jgi:hypothetical protein
MQLLIGSQTLFFNLAYKEYHHLVEQSWLTSLWCLFDEIQYKVAIR